MLKAYYYIRSDHVGRFIIKVISLHDIMDVFENTENNRGYGFIAQGVYVELAGSTLTQPVEQNYYVKREGKNN
jgi:hypothetical protein